MRDKIKREIIDVATVTLYFAISFGIIILIKKLLLEEYSIQFYGLSTALLGALVAAKVVILMDKTPWGDRFQGQPLVRHVAYRSLVYGLMLLFVMAAEKVYHLYHKASSLSEAVGTLFQQAHLAHFLGTFLCVWLTFVVYSAWEEIGNCMGEGELHRVFFSRKPAPDPSPETAPE